jgi:hypothetical protein
VNFFGHAAVASWTSRSPAFALGAMLPDFVTMIGSRLVSAAHLELRRGIEFHHQTDRVFHDSATFKALSASALGVLRELGLARGSARAVAHVGVEILLDGALASDERARSLYELALGESGRDRLGAHLVWRDTLAVTRFETLCARLLGRGVERDVSPELVALRLTHALAARPRLALDARGAGLVARWALCTAPVVRDAAPRVQEELRLGLAPVIQKLRDVTS